MLRARLSSALDHGWVEGQGGQALALGGVWTLEGPPRYLSVGKCSALLVDGSLYSLEQNVPLLGVKLEAPLA